MAAKREAKPSPTTADLVPANTRLPRALLDALDAMVAEANAANRYNPISRSDLIRDLLAEGVLRREAEKAAQAPAKAPSKPASASTKAKPRAGKAKG